jgi:hypothetical protein
LSHGSMRAFKTADIEYAMADILVQLDFYPHYSRHFVIMCL